MSKELDESFNEFGADEVKTAQAHAPGNWPKWGDISRGFNPAAIVRDGFKDVGDLKLENWKALGKSATWKGARPFMGDPEIHEALGSLRKIQSVADEPPVKSYLANVTANLNMRRYVTTPAVVSDYANHLVTQTHWKDGLLHDVGLGWAAEASG